MLEFSVQDYDPLAVDPLGGFLQVSGRLINLVGSLRNEFIWLPITGINVAYDVSRSKGDRVVELLARCNNCRMPAYHAVEPQVNTYFNNDINKKMLNKS